MDWDSPVQKNEFAAPSTRERGGEMQQIEENEGIRAAPLGCDDESNLRRALQISHGSFLPFLTRPVSCIFIVASVLIIVTTVIHQMKAASKSTAEE